jgi:hypothetical protein
MYKYIPMAVRRCGPNLRRTTLSRGPIPLDHHIGTDGLILWDWLA